MIWIRAARFGGQMYSRESKRPGRMSAGSRRSGLFVAARTRTPRRCSMPSISLRSVVRTLRPGVLEAVGWFPPPPPRVEAMASISSKKIMLGAAARALRKISRTARSDSPTYMLISSAPLMAIKFKLASVATALAVRVLEQPGGPYSRIPFCGSRSRSIMI